MEAAIGAMIRGVLAVACAICGTAQACGDASATRVASPRYVIAYTTSPSPVVTGEHFTVAFTVCPQAGAPAPEAMRVDATMPEHRHGMNYRTTVVATGPGEYRAQGMLFHMAGRWELAFDVVANGASERITSDVVID